MVNWLLQVVAVTRFSLQSLPARAGSALTSVFGIAGVVAVLVGVLSIAEGVRVKVQRHTVGAVLPKGTLKTA